MVSRFKHHPLSILLLRMPRRKESSNLSVRRSFADNENKRRKKRS